ncbi:hypothetical protein FB470_004425 [Amycolatopsis thermophila]|uniref:Uncharacterized protein n=1 Tax=Amycolatopsis thermophila TaxID=206084 RepID=A0ABU0EYP7_9PSEU|nr:hypothetical protein [Amycolatopsis thermophila]
MTENRIASGIRAGAERISVLATRGETTKAAPTAGEREAWVADRARKQRPGPAGRRG